MESLPRPRALLVVSAHWQTKGTFITANPAPGQIYDFYGFPQELYQVRYAPPGDADLTGEICTLIPEITGDPSRGIDHAGWAVALHLFPDADVPLLQLSLDTEMSEREHFDFGEKLSTLSDAGVLVVGSGNAVHNLGDIDFDDEATPFEWAVEADAWIESRLAASDYDSLIDYRACMSGWQRAIPTNEHYLPLLYILGMEARNPKAKAKAETIFAMIQNGSISMRSVEMEPKKLDTQPNNPLHGITLETIMEFLVAHYGWIELNRRIPVNCFFTHPSIKSSLKFLRKTDWARNKIENLYLETVSSLRLKEQGKNE